MKNYELPPDLESDLKNTSWIVDKVRSNEVYAQNLYAAMCNNRFLPKDAWMILNDRTWSCSWRRAGGIISDITEQGSYMDWYCSGIGSIGDQKNSNNEYVAESMVTDEIRQDLDSIGWTVIPYDEWDA